MLASHDLVRGLPNLSYKIDGLCKSWAIDKQTKGSFEPKIVVCILDKLNFYLLIFVVLSVLDLPKLNSTSSL